MKKSLIVSILGPTNAGKSTFLNKIIGKKIAIVTPKVQTTRDVINGSTIYQNTHMIFLDTPGLFNAKNNLDRYMIRSAWSTIASSDVCLLFFDGSINNDKIYNEMIPKLENIDIPVIICLNKSDKKIIFEKEGFLISAKNGRGITALLDHLTTFATDRQINEFKLTTLSMAFLASEITREKLFLNMKFELPYNLKVQNEQIEKVSGDFYKIHQVIVTNSESHKKIIVGSKGSMIKKIGTESREEIETIYGIKLYLKLFVRVEGRWIDKDLSVDLN